MRLVWASLMLLGFFITSFLTMPDGESGDWSKDVDMAAAQYTLQKDSPQGAPQQAVLNGWYTNDLLQVQTKIAGEQMEQTERISVMVLYLGLGLLGDLILRTGGALREAR
ncbi:hypothetical protein KZX06_09760 [Micrococcus sp. EYE_162]|uniref:hypothetical protein n=1 Tax=unclassified Micrococcus TaxID=2620948 RepID=UPI002004D068|nr:MULTISPECIES: hypothetical protein [unclassified Micrococcus]MCK6094602.1 hypothetical protein [Micrococcus sp. EYE_212]MCK6172302.1 hypothetical protein [Micrococcus sp. EYE_162]